MSSINYKNIKCIILDIDKTLTNNNGEVTLYTKNIIRRAVNKGIYVILCSGRSNIFVIEKSILCDASNIVISDNGSIIYDYKLKKIYYENPLNKEILNRIIKICHDNNMSCSFNAITKRYKYNNYNTDENVIPISSVDDIDEDVTQLVVKCSDINKISDFINNLSKMKDIQISNTDTYKGIIKKEYFCDINVNGVSKGISIKRLMDILNINSDEIICFGDSMNDYSMMDASNNFIAMKNADGFLKEKANYISEYDNDNDGVAHFINDYILN